MKKRHNIGLFKDENSAKILVSHFFTEVKYDPCFSDACNFGYTDDNRVMLTVDYEYWRGVGY